MSDTLGLIDQLIEEHKTVSEKAGSLEKAVNDLRLISGLKEAGDTFVRGGIAQDEDLKNLAQMINIIADWLEKHFDREEKVLKPAVAKYGDQGFIDSLDSLLFEHAELRDRMLHARKRIDELLGSSLNETRREAAVRDLRVHINHSRKLLETHATRENQLLDDFRHIVKKAMRAREQSKLAREISLSVNDTPISLDYFASVYLDHVTGGIVSSLRGTGQVKTVRLSIDGAGSVKINLNGADVPLNFFASEIIKRTIFGMVSPLKGVASPISQLEVNIKR